MLRHQASLGALVFITLIGVAFGIYFAGAKPAPMSKVDTLKFKSTEVATVVHDGHDYYHYPNERTLYRLPKKNITKHKNKSNKQDYLIIKKIEYHYSPKSVLKLTSSMPADKTVTHYELYEKYSRFMASKYKKLTTKSNLYRTSICCYP